MSTHCFEFAPARRLRSSSYLNPTGFWAQMTGMSCFMNLASCLSVGSFHKPTYRLIPAALYFGALVGDCSQTTTRKKSSRDDGSFFRAADDPLPRSSATGIGKAAPAV